MSKDCPYIVREFEAALIELRNEMERQKEARGAKGNYEIYVSCE